MAQSTRSLPCGDAEWRWRAGLVAGLLLVAGTAVLWPRGIPASAHASSSTRAPADPAALQRQLDRVVETGSGSALQHQGRHDRLLAHGRFLEDRFAASELDVGRRGA